MPRHEDPKQITETNGASLVNAMGVDANVFYQRSFRAQGLSCSTLSSLLFAWSLVRLITKYAAPRTYMKLCAQGHPASHGQASIDLSTDREGSLLGAQDGGVYLWRQSIVGNGVMDQQSVVIWQRKTICAKVFREKGMMMSFSRPVACEWTDLAWRIALAGASSQGGQVQRLFALRECLNLVSLVAGRSEACRPHDVDGIGCGLFFLPVVSGCKYRYLDWSSWGGTDTKYPGLPHVFLGQVRRTSTSSRTAPPLLHRLAPGSSSWFSARGSGRDRGRGRGRGIGRGAASIAIVPGTSTAHGQLLGRTHPFQFAVLTRSTDTTTTAFPA